MSRRRYRTAKAVPLSWWVPLPIAVASLVWWVIPHYTRGNALREPWRTFAHSLAATGVPTSLGVLGIALCGLATIIGLFKSGERGRLLDKQRSLNTLREMDWKAFERLVGEVYRRQGYQIAETGQGGADGGVDLVLRKGASKVLVQCKQWKNNNVGAAVVREMFGLMVHHRADRVAIVCVGKFTRNAWEFSKGKPIDLVGGGRLLSMVEAIQGDSRTTISEQ